LQAPNSISNPAAYIFRQLIPVQKCYALCSYVAYGDAGHALLYQIHANYLGILPHVQ
jgi:hypothetical protein